jgi:hypothetical protein
MAHQSGLGSPARGAVQIVQQQQQQHPASPHALSQQRQQQTPQAQHAALAHADALSQHAVSTPNRPALHVSPGVGSIATFSSHFDLQLPRTQMEVVLQQQQQQQQQATQQQQHIAQQQATQ